MLLINLELMLIQPLVLVHSREYGCDLFCQYGVYVVARDKGVVRQSFGFI